MAESKPQKQILDYLEARGHYGVNVMKASKAGVSDIVACIYGTFVGIEVKFGKNKAEPLQLHNLGLVQAAGGVGLIAYSVEDVQLVIDSLKAQKFVIEELMEQL